MTDNKILSNIIDFKVNGQLFPLFMMYNFKKYKIKPMIKDIEDPCNMKEKNKDNNIILKMYNYQEFITKYLDYNSPFYSLLLYHGLGSGKTATMINVYMNLFNYNPNWNLFILVKKSLKLSPWIKDLRLWMGEESKEPERWKNIHFIHYDSPYADKDFMNKVRMVDSNKKNVYVIEEAHNFIRNVYGNITSGEGKKALTIYNYIMQEKKMNDRTRVILMSGTPIVNQPFELALIFNLLRPNIFPNTEKEFEETYMSKQVLDVDMINVFQRRIMGLVSYYGSDESGKGLYAKKNIYIEKIPMSKYQIEIYRFYKTLENKLRVNSSSSYNTYTRQASNFVFPFINGDVNGNNRPRPSKYKLSNKDIENIMNMENEDYNIDKLLEDRYKQYLEVLDKYKKSFIEYIMKIYNNELNKKNIIPLKDDIEIFKNKYKYNFEEYWSKEENKSETLIELYNCSCKMIKIIFNSVKSKGPIIVYSNYVQLEGLELFETYLNFFDYSEYDNGKDKGMDFHRYIKFTGLKDKGDEMKRANNLEEFNKIDNVDGSKIKFILISPAGSEGITVMSVRQIHILEPYWNEVRLIQAIGRGVRNCSHKYLPMDERIVDIYRYHAITDNEMEETTDLEIYNIASRKDILTNSFLSIVKEVAIDCELFKEHNMQDGKEYNCFKFNDNNYFNKMDNPAYKDNIYFDKKMSIGTNASNSIIVKKKVYKIYGQYYLDNNLTNPEPYWYEPTQNIVYDYEMKYPIAKVQIGDDNLPIKFDKLTYLLMDIILIPVLRKF